MIGFLHTFHPQAILFSRGPITIYWYGFFMVVAILAALSVAFRLSRYYGIPKDVVFDLSFWLILGGIVGARIYDDLLQFPYYLAHPIQSLEIWKGGLAIHGGILAGVLITFWFAKKRGLSFWALASLLVPGLALAQAIGRWGNYFNQEIFGLPTALPWGIPIDAANRPLAYLTQSFFHPTFLYESLGCLLIAAVLIAANCRRIKKKTLTEHFYVWAVFLYMVLYSVLRFFLEYIRLDEAPSYLGLRVPQIASLLILIAAPLILFFNLHARTEKK